MNIRGIILEKEYNYGDKFNYYFTSDHHIESPEHDRKGLIKELDTAIENNCDIFIGGDVFNMILSGDRKRYTPSRDKYHTDSAVNEAIEEAVELYTPYAKNIKVILCGNHEGSMLKFHNIDPIALLIWELNKLEGVNIEYLGYQGFIRLRYKYKNGNDILKYDISAHHGTGGQAEITRGTITLSRLMSNRIADLYWNGHLHTKVILPDEVCIYMNRSGNIRMKSRKGIITAANLFPIKEQNTKKENGMPMPYEVSYGDKMRTFQSRGGIMMEQEIISCSSSQDEIITKLIC